MTQNLIDVEFSTETLAAIDAAFAALEAQFVVLTGVKPEVRRLMIKMGAKSELFCRQAVMAFVQNPDVLPRNFDIGSYERDLAALDVLRPRLLRLDRIRERINDSVMALGSDLMANSLENYAVLKVAGRGTGLENLRQILANRFNRVRATEPEAEEKTPEA